MSFYRRHSTLRGQVLSRLKAERSDSRDTAGAKQAQNDLYKLQQQIHKDPSISMEESLHANQHESGNLTESVDDNYSSFEKIEVEFDRR